MATQFFRGSTGSIKFGNRAGGTAQPLSEWTLTITTPEIDQSDYDSTTAKYALGIPTAQVTATGPYPYVPYNLKIADTATITLWLDESQDAGFTFSTLITNLTLSSSARGLVNFSLAAVANEDFYNGTSTTTEVIL